MRSGGVAAPHDILSVTGRRRSSRPAPSGWPPLGSIKKRVAVGPATRSGLERSAKGDDYEQPMLLPQL